MSEPDREGAPGDEMVEDLARIGGAMLLDLDTVGLAAAESTGELPQRFACAAAGVQQPRDAAMGRWGGADKRRHAFDDGRRSWIELRLRDALKATHIFWLTSELS